MDDQSGGDTLGTGSNWDHSLPPFRWPRRAAEPTIHPSGLVSLFTSSSSPQLITSYAPHPPPTSSNPHSHLSHRTPHPHVLHLATHHELAIHRRRYRESVMGSVMRPKCLEPEELELELELTPTQRPPRLLGLTSR